MSLAFTKALDLVKKYDGETIAVSEFTGSIMRAKKISKEVVEDDIWIASIEEKLSGKAVLFYKAKTKPSSLDDFIKMFEEKFASPTALAEFKEKLESIVQTNAQSCEDYLSNKIAYMSLLPAMSEAEKLISAKKGLLPNFKRR
ncbi:MAG: hypothetical protein ACXVCD_15525 [Pseudobdellovibrionaceae bacterium]